MSSDNNGTIIFTADPQAVAEAKRSLHEVKITFFTAMIRNLAICREDMERAAQRGKIAETVRLMNLYLDALPKARSRCMTCVELYEDSYAPELMEMELRDFNDARFWMTSFASTKVKKAVQENQTARFRALRNRAARSLGSPAATINTTGDTHDYSPIHHH